MQFPQLPVLSHEGTTLNFQALQRLLSQKNFRGLLKGKFVPEFANAVNMQFGVGEVEYGGAEPDSGLPAAIKVTEGAKKEAFYYAVALEEATQARLAIIVNATPAQFQVQLHSVVGNPAAKAREKFYWLAITQ